MDKIRRAIEMHRGSVPPQTQDSTRSDDSGRDQGEISEVEIYITYRQYNRAKALLYKAIEREPHRSDHKLKLLNVLFVTNDVDAYVDLFEKAAKHGLNKEDPDGWVAAIQMGAKLVPDNPLFANNIDSIVKDGVDIGSRKSLKNTLSAQLALVKSDRKENPASQSVLSESSQGNYNGDTLLATPESKRDVKRSDTDDFDTQLATLLASATKEDNAQDPGKDEPVIQQVRQTVVDAPAELATRLTANRRRDTRRRHLKYGLTGVLLLAAVLATIFWPPERLRPLEDKKLAAKRDTGLQAIEANIANKIAEPELVAVNTEPKQRTVAPNSTASQTPEPKKNETPPSHQAGSIELISLTSDAGNTISERDLPNTAPPVGELQMSKQHLVATSEQQNKATGSPQLLSGSMDLVKAQSGPENEPASNPVPATNSQEKQEGEISLLLAEAERYRQRQLLTTPENNNAYETYQQVLTLDPENTAAQQGMLQIAEDYRALAIRSLQDEKVELSQKFIERGLSLAPTNQGLLALQKELEELFIEETIDPPSDGESVTQLLVRIQEIQQQLDQLSSSTGSVEHGKPQDEYIEKLNSQVQQFLEQEKNREALRLVQNGLKVMPQHPQLNAQEKAIKQIIANRTEGTKEAARFVDGLVAQAAEHRKNGELEESLALVEVGLRLMHNHRPLLDLREDLLQAKQESQ